MILQKKRNALQIERRIPHCARLVIVKVKIACLLQTACSTSFTLLLPRRVEMRYVVFPSFIRPFIRLYCIIYRERERERQFLENLIADSELREDRLTWRAFLRHHQRYN
jgi:hypothetical protein